MKSRLIVNPVSGSDSAPSQLTLINARLREHVGAMDIVMTVDRGDAARASVAALRDGYDHLFVAGGDGTLNEVVNGVGATPGGFEGMTFGITPLGTGNDFATALAIPSEVEGALAVVTSSDRVAVDVGRLNDRYFINVSAGGFIAEVPDAVDSRLKTIAGKLAYLIGGAQILFSHEPVAARVRTSSGRDVNVTLTVFAVCNSRLIGGGRLIAPDACIDDGLFDVCLIEEMPTIEFLGLLKRVSNGEHVRRTRRLLPYAGSGTDVRAPHEGQYRRRGARRRRLSIPPPASGPAIHCALAWAGSRCADHHVSVRSALELGFRSRTAILQRALI